MLSKPIIKRLGDAAIVLPMPLSESSKATLRVAEYGCVYIGRSKGEIRGVTKQEIWDNETKEKAFLILGNKEYSESYLEFVLRAIPNENIIEKAREQRKLSTRIVAELLVPHITEEEQLYIDKLVKISNELHQRGEWDMDAELGALCLHEVAIAINAELFLFDLCAENNIHILNRWMLLAQNVRADMLINELPSILMRPGNTLMAEVRSLQRIIAQRNKARQDGLSDQ